MKNLLITLMLLLTVTLGCSLTDDVKEAVETVDDAVALLQEINDSGTWQKISGGLEQLSEQRQGYAATAVLQEGAADASGTFTGTLARDTTINLQADTENDILVDVVKPSGTKTYFVENSSSGDTQVYEVTNGRYSCASESEEGQQVQRGIEGLFDEYALAATGVQLLSVAKESGEVPVAGREATHYVLESRIPKAKEILEKFDNAELRKRLEEAGNFTITGSIDIDKDTEAMLRFASDYQNPDQQRRMTFNFEITQWGGVSDIPRPTPDQIEVACQ